MCAKDNAEFRSVARGDLEQLGQGATKASRGDVCITARVDDCDNSNI
jgi:hypothetical protein